jgi:multiple sugar transport system permease protein
LGVRRWGPDGTSRRLTPDTQRPKPRRGLSRQERQNLVSGLLFCSPWLIGFSVFLAYPILASLYYSLTEFSVLQEPAFMGPGNYRELMADGVFWKSLGNTFIYAMFALPLGMIVALSIAMLLNTDVKGMAVYRTIYFLPSLVPTVATAILWLWIFNGQYGVLNYGLSHIGVQGPNWLTDPKWVKGALVLLSVWGVGNAVVIYLAGLQDVPVHLYEAADLDGAHWLQKIRHVTLPMLSPVILFNLIIGIIASFQVFTNAFLLTNGGPQNATLFTVLYIYRLGFEQANMGAASALAWLLFLIILVFSLIQLRLSRSWVYYEGGET